MTSSTAAARAIVLALVVSTLVAFWPVRDNGFIGFDDPRYVTENERVRAGLSWDGVVWALTATHAYNWHPLTWISHMADVEAFGLEPGPHHLTSVAIHAVNGALLFALLRSFGGGLWPCALAAFLFALHPLRVESVAWASERKDVLAAMLWLVTMQLYVAYARRPGLGRYALVVVTFTLGLTAKPMLVTLPFALLLIDVWPLGRLRRGGPDTPAPADAATPRRAGKVAGGRKAKDALSSVGVATTVSVPGATVRRLLAEKAPLVLLAAGASAMTLYAQQGIVQSGASFPFAARLANALLSCARYLGKMVWPAELAVFYPYRERSLASPEVLAAVALLATLTALAVAQRRRGYPIVGWLWFLGTLVPVLGLVQAGIQSMADRYTYVPGIGILVAGVWGGTELLDRRGVLSSVVGRRVTTVAVIALLVLLGSLTRRQARTWRSDETLFAHAVAVTEGSYWARYNLGLTLLEAGRPGEAVPHLEEAVRLEPTSVQALVNLGRALEGTGRAPEAVTVFERAVDTDSGDLAAARHASRALVSHGSPERAARMAQEGAARWPEDPQLRYTWGIAELLLERPDRAVGPLRRAVELDPRHAAAHNALGIALARTGDGSAAIEHFTRAVELEPGYHEARENLTRLEASTAPRASADPR